MADKTNVYNIITALRRETARNAISPNSLGSILKSIVDLIEGTVNPAQLETGGDDNSQSPGYNGTVEDDTYTPLIVSEQSVQMETGESTTLTYNKESDEVVVGTYDTNLIAVTKQDGTITILAVAEGRTGFTISDGNSAVPVLVTVGQATNIATPVDLSGYYTKTEVNDLLGNKVSTVSGKGLSSNDYTTEEKTKLGNLPTGGELALALALLADGIGYDSGTQKLQLKHGNNVLAELDASPFLYTGSGNSGGTTVDLSGYYTKSETDTRLGNKQDKNAIIAEQLGITEDMDWSSLCPQSMSEGSTTLVAVAGNGVISEPIHLKAGTKIIMQGGSGLIVVKASTGSISANDQCLVVKAFANGESEFSVPSDGWYCVGLKSQISGSYVTFSRTINIESFLIALETALENKVNAVTGKGLSANDYTNEEKAKLAALPTNAQLQAALGNVTTPTASTMAYSNTNSGMTATNVQAAIDELAGVMDAVNEYLEAL